MQRKSRRTPKRASVEEVTNVIYKNNSVIINLNVHTTEYQGIK